MRRFTPYVVTWSKGWTWNLHRCDECCRLRFNLGRIALVWYR